MRAVVCLGGGQAVLERCPDPPPQPDRALVRIEAAAICGVDLARDRRAPAGLARWIPGHEAVGVVVSVPSDAGHIAPGARVVVDPFTSCGACPACRTGRDNLCRAYRLCGLGEEPGLMAEMAALEPSSLHPISAGTPAPGALWAEPLACAIHALSRVEIGAGRTLAIFGCGVQGSLALALARLQGVRVAVVEPDAARRTGALLGGAEIAIDPVVEDPVAALRAWSPGGAEAVLEAVGLAEVRRHALAAAADGADIVLLGMAEAAGDMAVSDAVRRELRLVGSFGYTRDQFSRAVRLLSEGAVEMAGRTRLLDPAECRQALCPAWWRAGGVLKVAVSLA